MRDRIREDHVPYDQWAAQGWITPTPGRVIDYTRIENRFVEYKNMYKMIELPFDMSFAAMLVQRLQQEHGLTVIDVPQQYATLTDPMNQIEVLLRNHQLSHEANPVAHWCFGNTSISKNGNAQIKYVKERKGRNVDRTKRIDLTTALVCAMVRGRFHDAAKSVYERRGIRTVG
jgi:phage terminase large subunit-like protein